MMGKQNVMKYTEILKNSQLPFSQLYKQFEVIFKQYNASIHTVNLSKYLAQSAGAVEYTDCTSAEG